VSETTVDRNADRSWTLYDNGEGDKVTLTFPANPNANFTVVTKDLDTTGLPTNITWHLNFGIKNPSGNFLPSVSYHLDATGSKSWFVYYDNSAKSLIGDHTSPGDPPIGTG